MRIFFLLVLLANSAVADNAASFLHGICKQGLLKEQMASAEATRFCTCLVEDVAVRLNQSQRRTIDEVKVALDRGQAIAPDRFASSGVRDLIVAGQARCEAAFYPPSAPISVSGGALQLNLRCDDEFKKPEAVIFGNGMALLSKADLKALDARIAKEDATPDYARVILKIDSDAPKTERWEIDMTGEAVSPPNAALLIDRLRTATALSVSIERGSKRYKGTFLISGKIPARWVPCGGIGR
jgi:hypothetical protein